MKDFPAAVLTATIWAYWLGVGVMIARGRRRTGRSTGVVPRQSLERIMWLVWVPLVAAWTILPYLAATRSVAPWAVPAFAHEPVWSAVRWTAALVGVACLALTIECWARMGTSWRMAVVPGETTRLVTDGLYARVRHPIYALSVLLMVCSVFVVPTLPFAVVGALHVCLMLLKARNEEAQLLGIHGEAYSRYLARTGRFLPRRSGHADGVGERQ